MVEVELPKKRKLHHRELKSKRVALRFTTVPEPPVSTLSVDRHPEPGNLASLHFAFVAMRVARIVFTTAPVTMARRLQISGIHALLGNWAI